MALESTVSATPSATSNSGIVSTSSSTTVSKHQDVNVNHKHGDFRMQVLLKYIKRASDYAAEHVDIDKVIREHDEVVRKDGIRKQRLRERDEQIKQLETIHNKSLDEHEQRHEKWCRERDDLMEKARREKEVILNDHVSELAQVQAELGHWKSQSASLAKEVQTGKREIQLTEAKLNLTTQKLDQWEQYTSHTKPLNQVEARSKIDEFFKTFCYTIPAHFSEDLQPDVLTMHEAWTSGIKRLQIEDVPFQVTHANTELAKKLRVALAMHTVSDELTKRVFQPWFIPDPTGFGCGSRFQETMRSHFVAEPKKGQLVRALWSSTQSRSEVAEVIQQRSLAAREAVIGKLSFMFNDNGAVDLRNILANIFSEAAKVWEELQYCDDDVQIVTCDDANASDLTWFYLEDFGLPREHSDKRRLLLFPGFYLPDHQSMLYEGYALFTDQELVIEAMKEARRLSQASRAGARPSRTLGGLSRATKRFSLSSGMPLSPPVSPTSTSQKLRSVDINDVDTAATPRGLGLKIGGVASQNGSEV
ncbi:hypothetical protein A1O1_02243 [Capronia coronata CBS 617.96]|uniref:Uncharacterized protein n=1 Tax=Capronia coronata CBS 617.96 TaxID=1182541 RepID=W9YW24_9EURO|nr:uncharacterized protein A1O1_02243 [Capronia coronata CBS 617.96]EXJ93850.1 hypothetical protein A1O1_02243 [Capronia coronata CBS 617.96]